MNPTCHVILWIVRESTGIQKESVSYKTFSYKMAVFLHWKMLNFSPSPWNQGEEALIGRYTTDTIRNNISYCRRTNMCRHCKQLALTRPKRAISKMPICKLQPQQQERTKIAIIGHPSKRAKKVLVKPQQIPRVFSFPLAAALS